MPQMQTVFAERKQKGVSTKVYKRFFLFFVPGLSYDLSKFS